MRTSDPDDAILRLRCSVPHSLNMAAKAKEFAVLRPCLSA
jgi:hypothetical protein